MLSILRSWYATGRPICYVVAMIYLNRDDHKIFKWDILIGKGFVWKCVHLAGKSEKNPSERCKYVMEHAERGDFAPEIKIEFFILYESQQFKE